MDSIISCSIIQSDFATLLKMEFLFVRHICRASTKQLVLQIIDNDIHKGVILVSFDTVNIFPSID